MSSIIRRNGSNIHKREQACKKCGGKLWYKHKAKTCLSGFHWACVQCKRNIGLNYYKKNRTKILERGKAYRLYNNEKKRVWYHNRSEFAVQKDRHKWWKKSGIDPDQAQSLFDNHNGFCGICNTNVPGGRGTWHVDHDHTTGQVRALLCSVCNVFLGKLEKRINNNTIDRFYKYLRDHNRRSSIK